MNKYFSIIFLILVSVIFITIQSTLLSPHNLGYYYPDLNLILIVFLAIFSEIRGGFFLALGNGYMMDVLSGNLPGTFTISRLSAYLLVRSGSNHVYLKKSLIQGLVIFFATICFAVSKVLKPASSIFPPREIESASDVFSSVGCSSISITPCYYGALRFGGI